ncbi:PEP-CTERM sorting domain-containing protein [Microcoleus sp. herbarium19]|uniref:PEP-CTERM sorting domain-containing protein n=1 Tax=unclassified Microcoleus TaxID=2642155 RepID=UPI002FD4E16A
MPLPDTKLDNTAANTDSDSSENIGYSSINNDATDLANISGNLLEDPELSSTDSSENQIDLASASSDLLTDPELSSTNNNENQVDLANISSDLLEDPELSSTDSNENELDLAGISGDVLEDPELSSEDNNSERVDLAEISSDLLEDPELSYLDDTLTAKTPKVSAKNTEDDALPAEAVPEPTTGLATLLALGGLGLFTKLKNRKNKD